MENVALKVSEIAYSIKNNPDVLDKENFDLPLTGEKLQFDAIDMCYLALEIMTAFNITITAEDLADYHFNTIRSVSERVFMKL